MEKGKGRRWEEDDLGETTWVEGEGEENEKLRKVKANENEIRDKHREIFVKSAYSFC